MANNLNGKKFTGKLPYKLTNDYFFKAFLQKNQTALRGILCAILSMRPEEITSIVITNPIMEGNALEDKDLILDIKLELNHSQIINLEMQVENLGNWPERSLTYLCRMFDQLKNGEDYKQVKKTIHIGILNFTPKGFPPVLFSDYFLYNPRTKHKYSDKFGIYMLQLNQLGNPEDECNMPDLYYWATLFQASTWEEIQMLAQKNDTIKKSIVTLKELTADEKAKMQMEARERYRRDMASALDFGKEQGLEQSKQKISALENDLEEAEIQKQSLQSDLEQSEIQNQSLQSNLKQSEIQNQSLQNDLEQSKSEIEKLSEHIRMLEEQLAETKKDI